jgi:hypothetical protein
MRWALAVAAVTLVALTGCGSADQRRLSESELANLVLQSGDLPGFDQFDQGRQVRSDAHPGPRSDPTRFDRQDGWKARYRRGGGPDTRGPLVVESRVDAFAQVAGAERDLDAYGEEFDATAESLDGRVLEVDSIGDEARALVLIPVAGGSGAARTYAVAWRDGRFTASVTANGLAGLRLSDVLELARKQEERIARVR